MTRIFSAVLFIMLLSACNRKQAMDSDKTRIVNLCEQFMQLFRDSKMLNAMEILHNNSIISKDAIDNFYNSIISQESILRRYGNTMSYDFLEEKQITEGLAKRYYIVRFEHYYTIFHFTIYKTKNGWRITHIKYDDALQELL